MSVDKATVRRIAHLARIGVAEDELEALATELSKILAWIEQLHEVDTENVAPLASVNQGELRPRDDVVNDGGRPGDVLGGAPDRHDDFFAVPKVVE